MRTIKAEKVQRIVVADSDANVRSALGLLLEQEPGARVVGETADADHILPCVVQNQADLALIDWDMLEQNAMRLLTSLRASRPEIIVVALSVQPEARSRAINAGIDAFVCKAESPSTVLSTLRPFITV